MKKLKLKIDFEKYNLKDKLLLGVLLIDCCILIWILLESIGLPIFDLIVIAVALNGIFVILYNRYSNTKEKNDKNGIREIKENTKRNI